MLEYIIRVLIFLLVPLSSIVCAHDTSAQTGRPAASASSVGRITDDTGRTVDVPQTVRRIVSLAPSITETLFALGLGDRVVGDTNYCDYPPEAKAKPHVGGPVNPNLETIASLHPDLVLASRVINRLDTVYALERLGIPVYGTDARTVEQVLSSTERLGNLIGAGDQGVRVVADCRRRLAALRDRLSSVEPKAVFVVVWQEPLISVGSNTFLADALRWAGARSIVTASQDWPTVSLEAIVRLRPEYLIFSSDDRALVQTQIERLRNESGWSQLDALRKNNIIVLGEAISRPSPRLVDAIEQLARALYAERFAAHRSGANQGTIFRATSVPGSSLLPFFGPHLLPTSGSNR